MNLTMSITVTVKVNVIGVWTCYSQYCSSYVCKI